MTYILNSKSIQAILRRLNLFKAGSNQFKTVISESKISVFVFSHFLSSANQVSHRITHKTRRHDVTPPLHPSTITPAAVHRYWETFITRQRWQPQGGKAYKPNQISRCLGWEVSTFGSVTWDRLSQCYLEFKLPHNLTSCHPPGSGLMHLLLITQEEKAG